MKAILEFEFPKDDVEFYWATNGATMNLVLWKMDQWLRGQLKFPENMDLSDDGYKALEKCREKLRELLDEYNLDLDK